MKRSSLVPSRPVSVTMARWFKPTPYAVLMHPRTVCETQVVDVHTVAPTLAVGLRSDHPKFAPIKVTEPDPVTAELASGIREMIGASYEYELRKVPVRDATTIGEFCTTPDP